MVTTNGEEHTSRAGCWLFLPWGHAIEYAADPANPFLVGGIHVIPEPVDGLKCYGEDAGHIRFAVPPGTWEFFSRKHA